MALNLAVLVLLALMRRFHLFWRELEPAEIDTPLAAPAPPEKRASVLRVSTRVALIGAAAVVFAVADGALATTARGLTNDASKLRTLTGWAPMVGLEEGLRRTIRWYRDHPRALGLLL